jgi:hypothetical protein
MTRLDDAQYRKRLQHFHQWLLDGRELKRLRELMAEARTHPRQRTSRLLRRQERGRHDLLPTQTQAFRSSAQEPVVP